MKPRFFSRLNKVLLLLAGIWPGMAGADQMNGHTADAEFDTNSSGIVTAGPKAVAGTDLYIGRQYYSSSANHYVVPFQLPNLGPGTFSGVSVTLHTADNDTPINVNLFALPGTRAVSTTLQTDVKNGAADHRTNGTLIMQDFWNSSTPEQTPVTTPADGTVDATLASWLNTAYADGANGGQFIFMRLSPAALYPANDQRGFRMASANNPDAARRPFITYTFNSTGSPPPTIVSFSATPGIVPAGGVATLSWEVTNADTVTISNGVGAVAPVGSTEVSPAGTTTYTLTATGPGGTRTATASAGPAGQVFFRYFRFTPTKLRNDASADSVQLAEFEMLKSSERITGATATNPGGNSPGGESPAQAVDNNLTTKWLDFNKSALVLDYGRVVNADGYRFATANDGEERDPVSWRVEGSSDNSAWTLLDEQTDFPTPMARESYVLEMPILGSGSAGGLPTIGLFTATPSSVAAGGSSTLNWVVLNANTVTINNGIGTVTAEGSVEVSPAATTTWTLTATNAQGTATATATVNVVASGQYRYFRFTPTKFRANDNSVQLAEFEITLNGARLTGATASNPGGDNPGNETPAHGVDNNLDTKWLDFNKGPLVLDFGEPEYADGYRFATANDSDGRDPVSWEVHGSVNGEDWVLLDSRTDYATPTERKTYIPVLPLNTGAPPAGIPVIASFTASPTGIAAGESATLSWNVTNATSVSIDNGVGTVAASGTRMVTPAATATYTLTAVGTGGTRTRTVQVFVATGGLIGRSYDTLEGDSLLNPISNLFNATPTATFDQLGDIAYENNFVGNVPGITSSDSFAVLWEGWFDVRVDGKGEYTFGTHSDDGSVIYLDLNNDGDFADPGELIVDNLGAHPMQTRTEVVDLQMDTVRIAIGFYESGGGEGIYARFKKGTGVNFADMSLIGGFSGHFTPSDPLGPPAQGAYSITGFTRSADGASVTLTWQSVAGITYAIQRSPDMTAGQWQDVKTGIAGQAGSTTDTAPAGTGAKQFFRIRRQ